MFFIASLMLILFEALSARCFYRLFIRFINISFVKKCFLSVFVSLVAALVCMYAGNMALAVFLQLIICFVITDILFVFFLLPPLKKRGITKNKKFRAGYSIFVVLMCLVTTIFGYFNYFDMKTARYDVSFADKSYSPSKLLFISDTHLSDRNFDKVTSNISKKINDENPDLIILGGDIFDTESDGDSLNSFCDMMKGFTASTPVLYVYGNHDTSYGASLTRAGIEKAFAKSGIKVLCDSEAVFGGIRFIGRDDYSASKNSGGRKSLKALIGKTDKSPVFIIDHQPIGISDMRGLGVDFSISGHTHNGQIFPTGILSDVFKLNELEYGTYKEGSYTGVVSSGAAGWGMNMRTEGQSEVVVINIR